MSIVGSVCVVDKNVVKTITKVRLENKQRGLAVLKLKFSTLVNYTGERKKKLIFECEYLLPSRVLILGGAFKSGAQIPAFV